MLYTLYKFVGYILYKFAGEYKIDLLQGKKKAIGF